MDDFHIYYANLPHWRQDNATYFVTWRLHSNQPPLYDEERDVVLGILKHFNGERYDVLALVIMDDHVHLLVYPYNGFSLEGLCSSWKSFSAYQLQRQFGRQGAVWQKESYDRIVRNEQELQEKANYILNNAFKRWPEIVEYKWIYPQREG